MLPSKSTPATIKITAVHVDAVNEVNTGLECKPNATIELARHIPRQRWSIKDHTMAASMLTWMRLSAAHGYMNKTTSTFTDPFWNYSTKAMAESESTRVFVNGDVIMSIKEDVPSLAAASLSEFQQQHPASVSFATNDTTSSSSMIQSSDPTQQSAHSLASGIVQQHDNIPSSIMSCGQSSSSTNKHNPVLPRLPSTSTLQHIQRNDTKKSPASLFQSISNLFTTTKKEEEQQQQSSDYPAWIQHLHSRLTSLVEDLKPGHQERGTYRHKIVIVGIHGWFPTKLVRSMIGEPTGTSQKFCQQMRIALGQYFLTEHQLALPEDAITLIPLEGEGKVEERVDKLYQQLLQNTAWLEAISSADVILWGTHSQGTPVSVMLLHQLLERGHISPQHTSICMLAMAGIGHGPFAALQGSLIVKYVEADAARELFEFMDSNSGISQRFRKTLAAILEKGIKLVLVASLQDQVVPLYSATLTSISHPNILRAVYIDKHVYADNDFLINLVVFALRLRNAGLSDHGLLVHLSEVLAGSIYAFEGGHSTIYEEVEVYLTAVRYLFQQPIDHGPQHEPHMEPFKASARLNPFYLPWAVRGIFDDTRVVQQALSELERLHQLFKAWTPTSTRLREIKFRLEPLADYCLPCKVDTHNTIA